MQWRRGAAGIGCAVGALALAGCATPGYSPGRIQSELIKAGTTPQQARCVTTGLVARIDVTALGSHSPPVAPTPTTASNPPKPPQESEYEITRDVLKECGVTLPLQPR